MGIGAVPSLYPRAVQAGRNLSVLVAALLGLAAGGCAFGSHDRAGGVVRAKPVVLTLAVHDASTDVNDWATAVDRLSHGTLRISVQSGWRHGEADYEKDTIADVRAGKASLASIPVRAYDTLGVESFDGLLAPFLIDTYALERKVLDSGLPAGMLAGVTRLGVDGVALVPGPLQEVLSVSGPMLAPADYPGRPIGIRPSGVAADTFRALGDTSTEVAPGADLLDQVDGVEQDPVELVSNRYAGVTAGMSLPYNVRFWPRVSSIVINEQAFSGLTAPQRDALRDAGPAAVAPAIARTITDERGAVAAICRPVAPYRVPGVFLLSATPADLAAMRAAVAPVYRGLDRYAPTRRFIAAVEAVKQGAPAPPATRCPGSARSHIALAADAGALRVNGTLTATSATTWQGTVSAPRLGRGRLVLRHHLGFRQVIRRRPLIWEATFHSGSLRGCVNLASVREHGGAYHWDGPGSVKTASAGLRRFAGLSVRFHGVVKPGDLRHVRGGFVSGAPNGIPCFDGSGI